MTDDDLTRALERIAALAPKGPFAHPSDELAEAQGIARAALAARSEPREHGENDIHHHYRLECEVCGQPGSVNVIVQPDYVRSEPRAEGLRESAMVAVMSWFGASEPEMPIHEAMLGLKAALTATPPAPALDVLKRIDNLEPVGGMSDAEYAAWSAGVGAARAALAPEPDR